MVTVGGFPVKPVFSGIAPGFSGLYQIDFRVPTAVAGDDVWQPHRHAHQVDLPESAVAGFFSRA